MKVVDVSFLPEPAKHLFEQTKQLAVSCEASPEPLQKDDVFISKIGGAPYFPKGLDYPKNMKGYPLALVAQINLDDLFGNLEIVKAIEKDQHLALLPRKGMISFFYDAMDEDGLMGLEYDGVAKAQSYQVVYFSNIVHDVSALTTEPHLLYQALIGKGECNHLGFSDVDRSYALQFSLKETVPPLGAGSPVFNNPAVEGLNGWFDALSLDEYTEIFGMDSELLGRVNSGHAIGGYPRIEQVDPREASSDQAITLLQIDSIGDIMIADMGIMQFFISEEDIKNLDFSNVLYSWACG